MTLQHGDLVLQPTTGSSDVTGFAIVIDDVRRGTVALKRIDKTSATIKWKTPELAVTVQALRLVLNHGLNELGLHRIEARVNVRNTDDIRAASISGLRREGILRQPGDQPDAVLLARLREDPPPTSREGFTALLNAGLPTKRVIGQGLLRNERGQILLCELTYKKEWDLPGGVVEVGEAPALGLVRELQEELGVTVDINGLVTVNWLPAWRGWDDACIFLFDLGVVDSDITAEMTLQASEIVAVHWCHPSTIRQRATAATIELLDAIEAGPIPPYREAPKAAE